MLSWFPLLLASSLRSQAHTTPSEERRNILHIIIDDLRPEFGAYGVPNRSTPNMDALAANGTVFDRAYCQQAVCGPSRNSFLTGRRPDSSRSWNFINHFREEHPEWTTIPGLFLKAGLLALGVGKTFHPNLPPAYDGRNSWSSDALPYRNPCWNTADDTKAKFKDGGLPCVPCPVDVSHYIFKKPSVNIGNEFCSIDAFEDSMTIDLAITQLTQASKSSKPFYLAVGLHKPHMPWQASFEDFRKHPLKHVDLPKRRVPPTGMPDIAFHFTDENLHSDPFDQIPDDATRKARRAYRSAVTGMDRKLGKLLRELEALGLEHNTAIVLHSDHGWQLGELGEWRKMTNFEMATRVPLIIKVPWIANVPSRLQAMVELVDVLPTIADLAGLSLPANETFDGTSLVPLLTGHSSPSAAMAFSQYPRRVSDPEKAWKNNGIIHKDRSEFTHMGYSIRTNSWRYTEWVGWNGTTLRPVWSMVVARELYDHRNETIYPTDFDTGEDANVAGDPANEGTVNHLSSLLRAQFT